MIKKYHILSFLIVSILLSLYACDSAQSNSNITGIASINNGHEKFRKSNSKQRISNRTKIKILSIGNSWAGDAFSYVPALLEEMLGEDVEIEFCIQYYGGCTLQQHYQFMMKNSPYQRTFIWKTRYGIWRNLKGFKFWDAIDYADWDIIVLQQKSSESLDYLTYQPYLNNLIDGIQKHVNRPVKFVWFMTPTLPGPNDEVSRFTSIVEATQRLKKETAIEDVWAIGNVVINARTTTLDSIGEHLTYDGLHLQEGLPSLLEAYMATLYIMNDYGFEDKSIMESKILPTQTWIQKINSVQQHGVSIGVTEGNIHLAKKVAIETYDNPYVVTDCGVLFENKAIVSKR